MDKLEMIDAINAYVLADVAADDVCLSVDEVREINAAFKGVAIDALSDEEYNAIVERLADDLAGE